MKNVILALMLYTISAPMAQATVYSGVMDNRAGHQFISGMTAQSKAWTSGGNPGEGLRLEWQVDNVTTPGAWTYTYRLLRGTAKNKGFAFFDIETASDFSASNILSKQVMWALNRLGNPIPSGLAAVTISDPVNFNALHDFSNAAVTERTLSTVLDKSDLSHYSGDPGRVPPGQPGGDASYTPSVGPVPHPFFGLRVTFPGTFSNLAYEASEWEFRIVSDRSPMWGSCFGWGDQTIVSPYWYSNFYSNNIDNTARLTLPPASNNYGAAPYLGWILVPGPLSTAQSSFLTVDLATYSREANGEGVLNLFATALPSAVLTVSGNGIVTPVVMTKDTPNPVSFGKYVAHIPYTSLPASVDLDNSLDPVELPAYLIPLVDEVNINQALYNPLTRTMTIKASSRDKMVPLPNLTAVDFAAPNSFDATGTFIKILTSNPPASVTVLSSNGGSATVPVNISSQQAQSVSSVMLLSDKPSPHVTGTPVTFTAVGTGGSGSYEFRYNFFDGINWSMVQNYSTVATWALPSVTPPGTYNVSVDIRNSGSTADRDTVAYLGYQVIAQPSPVAGATLLPSLSSPQVTGTPVTFTAVGTGGSGNYEFRFNFFDGTNWTMVQNYSSKATWTLPAATGAGRYNVGVDVRNAGSMVDRDQVAFLGYQIISQPAPVAGVTIFSDQATPHNSGTPVHFAAVGSGGSGRYEFRFYFFDGSSWAMVQDYSPSAIWILPGSTVAGTYNVSVDIRNAGSTVYRDAVAYVPYVIR